LHTRSFKLVKFFRLTQTIYVGNLQLKDPARLRRRINVCAAKQIIFSLPQVLDTFLHQLSSSLTKPGSIKLFLPESRPSLGDSLGTLWLQVYELVF